MPKTQTNELRFMSRYGQVIVYLVHKPVDKNVEVTIFFTLKPGCGYKVYHREWESRRGIPVTHANSRLDWDLPDFMLDYPLKTLQPLIEGIIEWHVVNNDLFSWDLEKETE